LLWLLCGSGSDCSGRRRYHFSVGGMVGCFWLWFFSFFFSLDLPSSVS
jgi:hypothetical protein